LCCDSFDSAKTNSDPTLKYSIKTIKLISEKY
jgi:hypothetical protein